jgi:hypothetical protein
MSNMFVWLCHSLAWFLVFQSRVAWALVMPDLSACATLVAYTNVFRFPQSAMEAPPITGIIAANSFDRGVYGYSRVTPSWECHDAISTQHATVFSSTECDATALGASYTTWTFTGGGLRCRQGELRFFTGGVITFDGTTSDYFIFRATLGFTIGAGVTFAFQGGASPSRVFFFSDDWIQIGTTDARSVVQGNFISSTYIVLTYATISGQVLTTADFSNNQYIELQDGPTYDTAGQVSLTYVAAGGASSQSSSTGGSPSSSAAAMSSSAAAASSSAAPASSSAAAASSSVAAASSSAAAASSSAAAASSSAAAASSSAGATSSSAGSFLHLSSTSSANGTTVDVSSSHPQASDTYVLPLWLAILIGVLSGCILLFYIWWSGFFHRCSRRARVHGYSQSVA